MTKGCIMPTTTTTTTKQSLEPVELRSRLKSIIKVFKKLKLYFFAGYGWLWQLNDRSAAAKLIDGEAEERWRNFSNVFKKLNKYLFSNFSKNYFSKNGQPLVLPYTAQREHLFLDQCQQKWLLILDSPEHVDSENIKLKKGRRTLSTLFPSWTRVAARLRPFLENIFLEKFLKTKNQISFFILLVFWLLKCIQNWHLLKLMMKYYQKWSEFRKNWAPNLSTLKTWKIK
jgi:hypothetical protein